MQLTVKAGTIRTSTHRLPGIPATYSKTGVKTKEDAKSQCTALQSLNAQLIALKVI